MFDRLPEYPWEQLKPYGEKARGHDGGLVDLSVGSPVDPTPEIIRSALETASNSPGYPSTGGSAEFKSAVVEWFARRRQVPGLTPENVMPSIGSKELISFLPPRGRQDRIGKECDTDKIGNRLRIHRISGLTCLG